MTLSAPAKYEREFCPGMRATGTVRRDALPGSIVFQIGERIAALQEKGVPWAASMKRIHEDRWEYIHSPFYSAGYALDPEFIECVGDLDGPTQDGVLLRLSNACASAMPWLPMNTRS
jgi:hypothetical protein